MQHKNTKCLQRLVYAISIPVRVGEARWAAVQVAALQMKAVHDARRGVAGASDEVPVLQQLRDAVRANAQTKRKKERYRNGCNRASE
jgi:hypothetical protein